MAIKISNSVGLTAEQIAEEGINEILMDYKTMKR